ncbi:UNVERIFIED_CONTAM: hypothetical protein FKN15_029201 [Acipenser sinensis]
MSKGGRSVRAAAPVSPDSSAGRCDPVGRPWARVLLCGLSVVLAVAGMLGAYLSNDTLDGVRPHPTDWTRDKLSLLPSRVSASQVHRLVSHVYLSQLRETHLIPLLVERLPGSPGSSAVRQHLLSSLRSLSAGWTVQVDSFSSLTPRGRVSFSNVLAVLDPEAPLCLLLACHYDSKKLPGGPFLGASDSAVPCAMLLELASALDNTLRAARHRKAVLTLQLVFFDGEEAFEEWTATDSLYGSRHLAELMGRTKHPPGEEETILLNSISYFHKDLYLWPVEDDLVPFLKRGVPVLHLVATPFPSFWHSLQDSEENLHPRTVENLTKILAVFITEYLGLDQ